MSDDYSSFERDYFRKSKRRQDFKQPKISPKHIKVYEPKSAQKSLKTQGYADEPDYSPRYQDDYYDDYVNYSKGETYKTYVSKTASSSKTKQGGNNKGTVWKKEIVRAKKGAGESQKKGSGKEDGEWVVSPKTTLFFEEKTATVNNSNPKTLPEAKNSSGEDSSMISAGLSTTANTEDRKSSEMFDFGQDRPDPIQVMKAMRRKEGQGEEKIGKKEEDGDKGKESTKDESNIEVKEESEKVSEDKEIGEVDENNYSDIDGLMEKKILNNEIEVNSDEDAFNETHETRKKDLEALENEERPLWEDLDTKKMLEDIKKFDHLPMFSKDIKSSWENRLTDGLQGNKELRTSKDIWVKDRKREDSEAEEDDDDFDKFFSLKICDDTDDVVPNIFHIWHKASSDKQARGAHLNENRLMKSQSFDSEIIKRRDSHTPLPAFRNYCLQQEPNKEEQPNPQTLISDKPKDSIISTQKCIFKTLIPNYEAKVWCYRDLQGNVQGPFSGKMMDEWYSKGYLPLELDITIAGSSGYRKLRELADVAAKTEGQNIASSNSPIYNNSVAQHTKSGSPSLYANQGPGKMLPMGWGHNQDNLNRDHGNMYNKGNGVLSSQNVASVKQVQPVSLFSNGKLSVKTSQNDNVDNKRTFPNIITENQCPNLGNFNMFANNLNGNNSMASKMGKMNQQSANQAQIQLSYPVFNSQFENYKGMNCNQGIHSGYRPQQMMNFGQLQGFDGSKIEANANQLRNLPR